MDFASTQLRTVPSYKSQIKDDSINETFLEGLKSEIQQDPRAELNCRYYLQKYLTVVRDKHLSVSAGDATTDYKKFDYSVSEELPAIVAKATDSTDEVVGIYAYYDSYKVAVVPEGKVEGRYLGVILEAKPEEWKPGMVKFVLTKTSDGYDGLFYDEDFVSEYRRIQFKAGRLYPRQWIKETAAVNYVIDPYDMDEDLFQYKSLNEDTHYVRLGSFSGQNSNYALADKLRREMESKIKGGNIIVDLRNNGGGGRRTSDLFLNFLKKNRKDLRVFVLQNYACGSDCEQFLLKLKAQQSVTTFGENTYGAVAYGFGNRSVRQETTPCYGFTLNLSEKKYEKFLDYEVVGVSPDQYLDTKSNWIEQVIDQM